MGHGVVKLVNTKKGCYVHGERQAHQQRAPQIPCIDVLWMSTEVKSMMHATYTHTIVTPSPLEPTPPLTVLELLEDAVLVFPREEHHLELGTHLRQVPLHRVPHRLVQRHRRLPVHLPCRGGLWVGCMGERFGPTLMGTTTRARERGEASVFLAVVGWGFRTYLCTDSWWLAAAAALCLLLPPRDGDEEQGWGLSVTPPTARRFAAAACVWIVWIDRLID